MNSTITVRGARLHNLKNITVSIPKGRLVVLTGVSGSGKSTLAFDILLKEGQRRYLETLGLLPLGMAAPPVDAIEGLSPTVSVDQRLTHSNPRSTVGTATGVYTFLRLLFARLGRRPCPACGRDIRPPIGPAFAGDPTALPALSAPGPASPLVSVPHPAATPPALAVSSTAESPDAAEEETLESTVACPHCGAGVPALGIAHFSFNKPAGACPTCTGLGTVHQADVARLVDQSRTIPGGAVTGWDGLQIDYQSGVLRAAAAHYGFALDLSLPVAEFTPLQRDLLFYGVESPLFRRHVPDIDPPATVRGGLFEGVATALLRRYAARIDDAAYRDRLATLLVTRTCPDCGGTRLRPESRAVTVGGRTIVDLASLPLTGLAAWIETLPHRLDDEPGRIAAPVLEGLRARIDHLVQAGAGYLAPDRPAPSLSAGEAQRLRLATLLAAELTGLLVVLDEPTIGLHQRDTRRLIELLRRLRDLGNTVLVVEHDLETLAAADYLLDLGPGAGREGGQVVAAGTPAQVAAQPESITGDFLSGRASIPIPQRRRAPGGPALVLRGARHHNLQDLTVRLPLGLLVAVTGVSGSGKSSLLFDVLERALRRRLHGSHDEPGEHDALEGCEQIDRVVTVDQAPAGLVPRSNTATYTEIFGPIRSAFAATDEARRRGLAAGHFSFNVAGGRCERCQGAGVLAVPMHFLPDAEVRCPACGGRRFTANTLAARYRGLDISQVLDLTVDEALDLFHGVPAARSRLRVLAEVGLGYLRLGQPASTLSGGEMQRVKLARELGRRAAGRTLYLLDEPTTGLHAADVARLLGVLQRLVDAGHSVAVVEHNLELVKAADWVIDLGPEGGAAGGRLMAEGTPEQVARVDASVTGQHLRKILSP